ncbi:MAG: GNAT family N-acetyltransferase [Lachnospiraceae bacterium]|nr:GNAT family N-acetyltransferase [Lachnospiraceae bacterium]
MGIRLATAEDTKDILRLLIQVNNVHAKLRPDLFIMDKTKYDEESLRKIISDPQKPIFVCINENGELCGYGFCLIQKWEGNNLVSHKSIYIDDICVDEAHRKSHVATSIYEYIVGWARENGFYNITLNVWDGNEPAIAFYSKKCGMTVQKTVMEQIL